MISWVKDVHLPDNYPVPRVLRVGLQRMIDMLERGSIGRETQQI